MWIHQKSLFSWPAVLMAASAIVGPVPADDKAAVPQDAAEFARAAEGYRSNRESFAAFRCRYSVTTGKAQTIQDAMDGKLTDAVVSQGLWLVDGKKWKYESAGDQKLIVKALAEAERKGATMAALPFDSDVRMTDGVIELGYSPPLKAANVMQHATAVPISALTPFGMGIMGHSEGLTPDIVLRDCVEGKTSGSYEGAKHVGDADLLVFHADRLVSFGGPDEKYRYEYLLDPENGYNPVQISGCRLQNQQVDYRAFITYRECPGRRWFPDRSVLVWYPERKDPPYNVREIEVAELDAEAIPAAEEFYLDLPKGIQVSVPGEGGGYYYMKKPQHVTLTDLQDDLDRCNARALGAAAPPILGDVPAPMPRIVKQPTPRYLVWINAITAGVLAILAACLAYRSLRGLLVRRPRHPG